MSASFSKHTFSRSIFRTVTCNKVIKEALCRTWIWARFHFQVLRKAATSPFCLLHTRCCGRSGKIISVAFSSVFCTTLSLLWKPATATPAGAAGCCCASEERDVFSLFQGGGQTCGGGRVEQEAADVVSRAEHLRGEAAAILFFPFL